MLAVRHLLWDVEADVTQTPVARKGAIASTCIAHCNWKRTNQEMCLEQVMGHVLCRSRQHQGIPSVQQQCYHVQRQQHKRQGHEGIDTGLNSTLQHKGLWVGLVCTRECCRMTQSVQAEVGKGVMTASQLSLTP